MINWNHQLKCLKKIQVIRPSLAEPYQQGEVSGADSLPIQDNIKINQQQSNEILSFNKNSYFKSTFVIVLIAAVVFRLLQIVNFL